MIQGVTRLVPVAGFIPYSSDMRQPERSDYPLPSTAYIGMPNVFVATMLNLRSPGAINTLTIMEKDLTVSFARETMKVR